VDFDIKSELEVIYADILDAKVGEFLKNFMTDLDVKKLVSLVDVINLKLEIHRIEKDLFERMRKISRSLL